MENTAQKPSKSPADPRSSETRVRARDYAGPLGILAAGAIGLSLLCSVSAMAMGDLNRYIPLTIEPLSLVELAVSNLETAAALTEQAVTLFVPTETLVPSSTASFTPLPSETNTPTATLTRIPPTRTRRPREVPTRTPTPRPTRTATRIPSRTPTPVTPSATLTRTPSPLPPTSTVTNTPLPPPTDTFTPEPPPPTDTFTPEPPPPTNTVEVPPTQATQQGEQSFGPSPTSNP